MDKKEIAEVLVISVMSVYERAKKRARVDSELSEEFGVKVVMNQGSELSMLLLAVVVDVVTEFDRGAHSKLLSIDDLVLMSETIKRLRYKFLKWKEAFQSKGLKVNPVKSKGNGQRRHHKGWYI